MDLVITVCSHADERCPGVPAICCKEHWPHDNPARAIGTEEDILAKFRRIRDEIRMRIESFLADQAEHR